MRVRACPETLDERRQVVVDLLDFKREDQPATVMFVIEGWRYLMG